MRKPNGRTNKDELPTEAPQGGPRSAVVSRSPTQPKRSIREPTHPEQQIRGWRVWTLSTGRDTEKPLNRENTCPRWDSNRTPALEYPATPTQTSPIRPSLADIRPDPKPRVCTMCTPSFLPTSASQTGCLNGRPGGARFRSNMEIGLRNRTGPEQAQHFGAALLLEIHEHHGGGSLLAEVLIEKRTTTCMTNLTALHPRSEHGPPPAQWSRLQTSALSPAKK